MPGLKYLMIPLIVLMLVHLAAGNLLQLARWQARHAMEEKLEHKQLVTLKNIPPQDITWVKKGKEILVNGRLFDVKDMTRQENGLLSFTGLFDTQEQEILAMLQQNNSRDEGNARKLLTGIFQQVFLYAPGVQNPQLATLIQSRIIGSLIQNQLPDYCREIPTPPPQA